MCPLRFSTVAKFKTVSRSAAWAERFERQMDDAFSIQEEIALSIAQDNAAQPYHICLILKSDGV